MAGAFSLRWGIVGLLFGVTACGSPSPLPDMEAGETGRVVRVIDGDALVLDTGQSVRLVSIEAPALRPRNRDPDPYAVEASRTLEDMALGRQIRLYYPGLTRDRYDRALAHVVTIDGAGPELWLNKELIVRGAARVRLYPDTARRGEELLVLENEARAAGVGLWSKRDFSVPQAPLFEAQSAGFSVLIGTFEIREAGRADEACIWTLQGADLTVAVDESAVEICDAEPGGHYRLRGWVSRGRLYLTHPLHAETLE